ncbi:MAG: hypothetical protein ACKOEO_27300 [Planctomycetaceae bacterium]
MSTGRICWRAARFFLFLGATLWPLLLATASQRSSWTPDPLGNRTAAEIREAAQVTTGTASPAQASLAPAAKAIIQ